MAELSAWNLDGVWRQKVSPDSAAYRSIYVDQPSVADPWSDEFEDGPPDLAERGWLVYDANAGDPGPAVPCVRIGEVDPTINPATIPRGSYRSSIRKSKLLLQGSAVGAFYLFVTRPVPREAYAYAARVQGTKWKSGARHGLRFANEPHTQVSATGAITALRSYETSLAALSLFIAAPPAVNVTLANVPHVIGPMAFWMNARVEDATTLGFQAAMIESEFVHLAADNWAQRQVGSTTAYAGIQARFADGLGSWVEVDYIRRYPAGSFFPP